MTPGPVVVLQPSASRVHIVAACARQAPLLSDTRPRWCGAIGTFVRRAPMPKRRCPGPMARRPLTATYFDPSKAGIAGADIALRNEQTWDAGARAETFNVLTLSSAFCTSRSGRLEDGAVRTDPVPFHAESPGRAKFEVSSRLAGACDPHDLRLSETHILFAGCKKYLQDHYRLHAVHVKLVSRQGAIIWL
jgi:hypothetical protein